MLSSCGIKTTFNSNELKWIEVYKEGDSLIFKSDYGEFDTSIIVKKEIYYPDYNPVELHGTYLPHTAVVWYKNKNRYYHPDGYSLIEIAKGHPRERTSLVINYLYSGVIISNLKSDSPEKYKSGKVYEFDTFHPEGDAKEPKKIFWHEDKGIIKYINHAGEIWERVNFVYENNP